MAIIEVKMVTGWVPITSSLERLKNDASLDITKYELDGNKVIIYLDKIDSNGVRFSFEVEQDIRVTNPKKASVKVYDYYETEKNIVLQYNIRTTCGTKEELPYLTPEEYNNTLYDDVISQVRVPISIDEITPIRNPVLGGDGVRSAAQPGAAEPMGPTGASFSGRVRAYRNRDRGHCKYRSLEINTRYIGEGGVTNMTIIEVKMVRGWVPITSSLEMLKNDASLDITKYELDGNKVIIYLDKIDSNGVQFSFEVEQDIRVTNPKIASVKVYDYYEREKNIVMQYNIRTTCGTKEELPYLTPEEYNNTLFDDVISQVRVPGRIPVPDGVRSTAQPGAAEPTGPTTCPVCIRNINTRSRQFKTLVCSAGKIYKVLAGRSGSFPFKIYADLRTRRKTPVNKWAKYNMKQGCSCTTLPQNRESKILVFTASGTFSAENSNKKRGTIVFSDQTTIIPWTKTFEKFATKIVRRRKGKNKCP